MKKIKFLVMVLSVMLLWIVGQPMEAHAKTYTWRTCTEGTGWYEYNGGTSFTYVDSHPINLTEDDSINIDTALDEENTIWLANLNQTIDGIEINTSKDTNLVIGKQGGNLKASIHLNEGNVTFNGYATNASIWGSDVILNINGDVNIMQLGSVSPGPIWTPITGDVSVNGNVEQILWIEEREECTEEYHSFIGNCTVSGIVTEGVIMAKFYDDALKENVFCEIGEIGKCEAGTFTISNGILSDKASITRREPVLGEYYYVYSCFNDRWSRDYYNKMTKTWAKTEACTFNDIPENGTVWVQSASTPIVINKNLNYLCVYQGDVTLNGDIVSEGDGLWASSTLLIMPKKNQDANVVINGNVPHLSLNYINNPELNVTISGKVTAGEYIIDKEVLGYFECENVQLIKNGVWNENVLIKTALDDEAIIYEVVDEVTVAAAVGDATIGQEIIDGQTIIVKSVQATIEQTAKEVVSSITKENAFQGVINTIIEKMEENAETGFDANAICAVDISIDSFYRDKNTGSIYTANPAYGKENISELTNGKMLEFSVKVPKAYYQEDAKYTIVRQHEKADGSVVMEQLETIQNDDMLTFESDKFSTFVIVEIVETLLKDTGITITNVDGTVVKKGGIDESSGKFSFSGLVAGVYKLDVTRANYVSRTYTVDVKTDSQTVELSIELHKLGDITGDGVINARDKKILFNHIAGSATLEDYDLAVGDVTGDGVINARDKKMVFNHIAGTSSLWE